MLLIYLTRSSLGHKITRNSTQVLVTLRCFQKLRLHKWLPPLLMHRTKEDSWALILGLDSSVMLLQSYQRQSVKGNVVGGGSGHLGQHWVEKEGRRPSISKNKDLHECSSEEYNQTDICEEIMEIGSCGYGGWEVSQFTICRLENQGSQWYNSVPVWRAKNQELWWPRAGRDRYPRSRREKECSLCLFVLFGPSTNWMMCTHTGEDGSSLPNVLIQSSSWNILIATPRNHVLAAVWAYRGVCGLWVRRLVSQIKEIHLLLILPEPKNQ